LAQSGLEVSGVEFRFLWPATGMLSPDVLSVPGQDGGMAVHCGVASFPNGESSDDLGAALHGLLLISVTGDGAGDVVFTGPAVADPVQVRVAGEAGAPVWYPVAILPTNLSFRHYALTLDGTAVPLPDWSSSCRE
jgi:hypothetical protein